MNLTDHEFDHITICKEFYFLIRCGQLVSDYARLLYDGAVFVARAGALARGKTRDRARGIDRTTYEQLTRPQRYLIFKHSRINLQSRVRALDDQRDYSLKPVILTLFAVNFYYCVSCVCATCSQRQGQVGHASRALRYIGSLRAR